MKSMITIRVSPSLRALCLALVPVVLAGCASGPNVIANRAPGFDLVNYRTFDFMQPLSTDNG